MTYRPGLVAVNVINESGGDVSKSNHFFPVDSEKNVVVPRSQLRSLTSRVGLTVTVIEEDPDAEYLENLDTDRAFNFVKDQDQNVTNRSPGSLDDWLSPTSAETTAVPAMKHGRLSEVRLEKGAKERADELGVDLLSVSGTGEEGMLLITDVENAYEGVATSPRAGVKGGADLAPREEGVLAAKDEDHIDTLSYPAQEATPEEVVEQNQALEDEHREAIEYQREVDTATPPPPHHSGTRPDLVVSGEPTAPADAIRFASRQARERAIDLNVDAAQIEPSSRRGVTVGDIEEYHQQHASSGLVDERGDEAVVGPIVEPDVDEVSAATPGSEEPAVPDPAEPDPPKAGETEGEGVS